MRVRATRTFRDTVAGTYRDRGEVFEVTPERLEEINSTRYGQLAEEIEEPAVEAAPEEAQAEPRRARRTRRTKE